ncbi:phosphodiester glycosidase family protein [Nostoc sp. UCD121]|uniref:phosphodiester glycosidase family protein n=1 Tax=unclassified Nostoc TaxID=2593658 RepID=UPI00162398CF|nr:MULTISPECIES: phosphodiester glycosidase family protein [unclassified Nostoc]MBC1219295.1 phosphodiester glycosidase family protein [Nostoc sp. UCD120]MBC1276317.1 phosphodiester glycosidase family protein [Nostoc sp. UCD121]MBC1295678.1 phosphodiester glycosidase family protein [Nostoc sp. UCD122]
MPSCCQSGISERRFFLVTVSPILLTLLCLTTTGVSNAQELPKNSKSLISQSPAPPLTGTVSSGNQISLNGRTLPGTWLQRPGKSGQVTTHLSDGVFRQLIGVNFLTSSSSAKQPIQWFSSVTTPLVLATRLVGAYRYLDITNFAQTSGWQIQANGNTLVIATPKAQITNIVQSQEPPEASAPLQQTRILVNLDRPTPWQVAQGSTIAKPQTPSSDPDTPTPKPTTPPNREWTITLDGIADPVLIERYTPQPAAAPTLLPNLLKQLLPVTPTQPIPPAPEPLIRQVQVVKSQTIISLSVPFGLSPQVKTSANPNRLIIDIRPDPLEERDITWAPGLRWRQRYVNLGTERFPVVWLEVNPRKFGLTLKPMWASPDGLGGTAPLIQTAQRYLAVAGINGGYFNRNNRLPLGAIRRDSQWLSGPILNRGAIAWNDSGQFYFGRLTLEETLITANNQRLPILFLNSGYVQSGIARYTPVWGATYTPLTDNEIILVVQKDQITQQLPGGKVGGTAVPIPQDGYLLTLRASSLSAASQLTIGSAVRISSSTTPTDVSRYPHIIGAGPLLIQNRQIVLDAKAEKFSNAFIAEKAIRSGICTTATGTLMIAAVHNRAGGYGPTLAEHAQLMQQMGCVDALNLDGGSSTSLYLGGQLLDRSPSTAARVHNGIGIFLKPR